MTELHPFTIKSGEETFGLRANACAMDHTNIYGTTSGHSTLYILSAIGPGSAVKAAAAMLNRAERHLTSIQFDHELPPRLKWWGGRVASAHYNGVKASYARLAMDTWQLLAVAKDRQLATSDDDESIWQFLKGEQFTTPLLRSWLPEVVKQLKIKNMIHGLHSFGCQPCLVRVQQDKLDEIVSTLVSCGALKIQDPQQEQQP